MRSRAVQGGIAILVACVVGLGVMLVVTTEFNSAMLAGVGAGAVLGALNLVVGSYLTSRSIRRSNRAVLGTMLGGFMVRLLLLAGLFFYFQTQAWINELAFAFSFMAFFCLFLALEIRLIERSLSRTP